MKKLNIDCPPYQCVDTRLYVIHVDNYSEDCQVIFKEMKFVKINYFKRVCESKRVSGIPHMK